MAPVVIIAIRFVAVAAFLGMIGAFIWLGTIEKRIRPVPVPTGPCVGTTVAGNSTGAFEHEFVLTVAPAAGNVFSTWKI